ncbi:uncharacterized protein LOC131217368 [Magnolia sinica]|uniref:uncharacterized protein LOC131217368 n=1 Tax=Magnolia sinica TaxID=86752 RepID=UPI00265AAEC5|nr:uncharacterized protein LOC131217368 [Magnolia sinica]
MDLRHHLERKRERKTPEIENGPEIVAENKDQWEARFAELNDKFLTLERKQQLSTIPVIVQAMMEETKPPFTSTIMDEVRPQRFQIPPVIQYSGSGDPSEYVEAYCSWMQIQTTTDAMMCRGFSITLTGSAQKLSRLFLTQFTSDKKSRKPNTHLLTIKQGPKESLKDYIARVNEEALQVEYYNDKMTLNAVFSGLKEGRFTFSIGKNPPKTLAEFVARAQKYNNAEEFTNARKSVQADSKHRDERKFYHFNQDHGHNTNDYVDLKDEIKSLIHKGHLCQYAKRERAARKEEREQERPKNPTKEPAEIRTIFGGLAGGGDSNSAPKTYSRKYDSERYIHLSERPSKELRINPCSLTFTEDDAREIQHPHDDALVITMTIANHKVYRILVDTGSLADVIYSEAFEGMRVPRSHLRPMKTPLHGFAGERVISEQAISLPVTAGEGQHQVTIMVDFLVVNVPSVHNIILGRPSLNAMRAVVSTYHLKMKFQPRAE